MVNFTKATNYAVKDNLSSGDPAKIIRGSELDDEFNSLQVVTASKADTNSPSFTGVPTATTAGVGTNNTQIATTAFATAALIGVYPVGAIFMATVSTSPTTLLGFGTWVAFGAGRVMMAAGGSFAAGSSGGSTDTVSVSHSHSASSDTANLTGTLRNFEEPFGGASGIVSLSDVGAAWYGGNATTANRQANINATHSHTVTVVASGVSGINANLQPYIVVYIWNRTA